MRRIAILVLGLAALLAGCGGGSGVAGNGTDRAFVKAMVPHHESAVEMAKLAEQRGSSPFVKRLAAGIVKTQDAEIATMRKQDAQLADAGIKTGSLGMSHSMMGMDMDLGTLETAKPFDRAFLQMMIPHHEGALTMAKAELAKGKDPQLRALARQIIAGQTREIDQMRARI